MTTVEELEKRVDAGINYLNENHPGWADKINVDSLDINSSDYCICGQLDIVYNPRFNRTKRECEPNSDCLCYDSYLGFMLPDEDSSSIVNSQTLNRIWEKKILEIRASKKEPKKRFRLTRTKLTYDVLTEFEDHLKVKKLVLNSVAPFIADESAGTYVTKIYAQDMVPGKFYSGKKHPRFQCIKSEQTLHWDDEPVLAYGLEGNILFAITNDTYEVNEVS